MQQSVLDLMVQLLLPLMKHNTMEFKAFNYAVNSYVQGNKKRLIHHLKTLTTSFDYEILVRAKKVIKRARLENF